LKLPIIGSCHGDVSIFGSLQAAQSYLEPQDVENGDWKVFDADGYLLTLDIESGKYGRREVVLGRSLDSKPSKEELRVLLVRHLQLSIGGRGGTLEKLVEVAKLFVDS